jgi:hypothetical protein
MMFAMSSQQAASGRRAAAQRRWKSSHMQNKSFARIEGRRQEELYEDVEFDAMRCTASEADHLHASAMYSVKM